MKNISISNNSKIGVSIKNLKIKPNTTLLEAMKTINNTGQRCLLVVNKNDRLLGTLTDGDLRRQFLSGADFKSKIENFYNKKPIYVIEGKYSLRKVQSLMYNKKIEIVPIVDNKGKILNFINYRSTINSKKENLSILKKSVVFIMAGGKGTRLAPFTDVLPKPLLPLNKKTVIEHIIEKFTSVGVKNFYLSINYKSLILKSYFKELKPKYSVKFVKEIKPLGTVGSLKLIENKFKRPIFLSNCDTIINTDYSEVYKFHIKNKFKITIVVSAQEHIIPYGICELNLKGQLLKIDEKPKHNLFVNTGLYIIDPSIIKLIPKNRYFDITDLIKKARSNKMKVGVFPIDEDSWIDVGQLEDYRKQIYKL